VLRKLSGGYHDIETVFLKIGWADEISVSTGSDLTIACDDPGLAAEDDNLCLAAARLMREEYGIELGVSIDLKKRIPMGAGLGGGSSDAAVTLTLLNRLWGLDRPLDELFLLASRLGSDVPLFLCETPALGRGRGEILSALVDPLTDKPVEIPFSFAVIKPQVHVSTAGAYAAITPNDVGRVDLCDVVESLDLDRWSAELVNDFEAPMVSRHQEIREALTLLGDTGAGYAAMSGSGSAVFGAFEDEALAQAAAAEASRRGLRAWSGRAQTT